MDDEGEMDAVVPWADVTEEEAAEHGDLRAHVRCLAKQIAECYLDLGEALSVVRDTDAWKWWGAYGSFFDWVFRECGFKKSRAEQLMCVWRRFGRPGLGLTKEQLGVDSWTKLRALLPIIDEGNSAAWLELARRRDVTVEDIKSVVRRARDSGSRVPVEDPAHRGFTWVRLGFHPSQATHFWSVAKGLHEITGDPNRPMMLGNIVDLMCAECDELLLVDPNRGGVAQRLEWYVENLERVFNVRISWCPRAEAAAADAPRSTTTGKGATS